MKKRKNEYKCILESEGFILGKNYECVSSCGKYLDMIDEQGIPQVMTDTYFKKIRKGKER
jgi:hypothetical protein